MYKELKEAVDADIFDRMSADFPEMLETWNHECATYNTMTDEEIGECGENLTRFQVAVFGAGETIEDYLDEMKI